MDSEPQKVLTPLEESKAAITHAQERIAKELEKDKDVSDPYFNRGWFNCFSSVVTTVHGFLELAEITKQISGEELENAKENSKKLFDKIDEIRDKHGDKRGLIEVSEETKEELLGMLDIYKK